MKAFMLVLSEQEASLLVDGDAVAGVPTSYVPEDGKEVYTVLPGDRRAVYDRLYDAVGVWLVRTPQIRQSASSLSRFLMRVLEDGEIPDDDAE